jgi:hypothetical protein
MEEIGAKYVGCSKSKIQQCISVALTASVEMFNTRKNNNICISVSAHSSKGY